MKNLLITATLLLLLSIKPLFAGVAKGVDVREVQTILTELCFNLGPIDGVWGQKTEKAAKDFFSKYSKFFKGYTSGDFTQTNLRTLKVFKDGLDHSATSGAGKFKRCSVKMSEKMASISKKLAKRKTINLFKPWFPEEGTKGYGLYWAVRARPSFDAITLLTPQWNNYHPAYNNYPGVEEFLMRTDWDQAAEYGKSIPLDYSKPNFNKWFVDLVDKQIGSHDGIMLDWWQDRHKSSNGFSKSKVRKHRHLLSATLRKHFGEEFIIMGNVNYGEDTDVKNLNGVFMELYKHQTNRLHSTNEIFKTERALKRFQKELRHPKIIALEGWRKTKLDMGSLRHSPQINKDRNSIENRRMAKFLTAMTITITDNGYVLYADNNPDTPNGDHAHIIYDFYSFDIGKPTGGYERLANGVGIKQHQKGFIAYNRNSRPHTLKLDNNVNLVIEGTSGLFCKKKSSGYDCLPPD